jgi:hypothetical protein
MTPKNAPANKDRANDFDSKIENLKRPKKQKKK